MLVLTRKADESIVIDGRITIKVLQLRGNRIRLGIEAPPEVVVRRAELPPLTERAPLVEQELVESRATNRSSRTADGAVGQPTDDVSRVGLSALALIFPSAAE